VGNFAGKECEYEKGSSIMTPSGSSAARMGSPVASRAPVQIVAATVAVVFLAIGILGFIPGVTTNYDSMTFAGHHSSAMLLGVFAVSILHNIVHLLFGVIGLALLRTPIASRRFLIGGGLIYLALWIYGLVVDHESSANFVPVNNADNWLHLGLAVGMIVLGVLLGRSTLPTATNDSRI